MNLAWRQQKLMVFIIRGENKSHLSCEEGQSTETGREQEDFPFSQRAER